VSAEGGEYRAHQSRIEWPYVALLVGLVVMVVAALHLLSARVCSNSDEDWNKTWPRCLRGIERHRLGTQIMDRTSITGFRKSLEARHRELRLSVVQTQKEMLTAQHDYGKDAGDRANTSPGLSGVVESLVDRCACGADGGVASKNTIEAYLATLKTRCVWVFIPTPERKRCRQPQVPRLILPCEPSRLAFRPF
jgi:hypothetical protein